MNSWTLKDKLIATMDSLFVMIVLATPHWETTIATIVTLSLRIKHKVYKGSYAKEGL
jgi:hypothetical protein